MLWHTFPTKTRNKRMRLWATEIINIFIILQLIKIYLFVLMFIVAGPQSSRKTSEIKKQLHSWETVVERVPMSSLHNRFHCRLSMEFRQPQNYEFRNINLKSITHTVLKNTTSQLFLLFWFFMSLAVNFESSTLPLIEPPQSSSSCIQFHYLGFSLKVAKSKWSYMIFLHLLLHLDF